MRRLAVVALFVAVPREVRADDGGSASHYDQRLVVDGEERSYFLHVPSGDACESPCPLLVDFHGTSTSERPEEGDAFDALVDLSDLRGFVLVRPRATFADENGERVYRWDERPGDALRNVA